MSDTNQRLEEIGKLIRTQDNRITDRPIFIVQQRRREYGYDPEYCEDYEWRTGDFEYEASDEEMLKLEALDAEGGDLGEWQKCYYRDWWVFVTACFTEQGCKDYININGHNLNNPRIYAESSHRNEEFRIVRDALVDFAITREKHQIYMAAR